MIGFDDAFFASLYCDGAASRGLPREAYADPAYFEAERRHVFARQWVAVAVGADLPAPGDLYPVTVAGSPVLLARGRDGVVRAFHNVCRHRGVQLVTQPERGRPVVLCPYHAWSYTLEGALRRTPHVGGPGRHEASGIDRDALGLLPVHCGQWADVIFVNLADRPALSLDDWLAPLSARWARYDLSLLRHAGVLDFELGANWKLAVENTLEFYHLPLIHPTLNSYSPTDAHDFFDAGGRFVGAASTAYRRAEVDGVELPTFPGLDAGDLDRGEYPVVFPNLFPGLMADHLFAVILEPVAPDRTRERFHVYVVGDEAMAPRYDAVRAAVLERWRSINLEDVAIVERMQYGHRSPGFDGGVFAPHYDVGARHFMRMAADHMLGRM